MHTSRFFIGHVFFTLFVLVTHCPLFAIDPWKEIKSFSHLDDVDPQSVANGQILGTRVDLNTDHGIGVETLFLTPETPSAFLDRIRTWTDSTQHEHLEVYGHYMLSSPVQLSDFDPLHFDPSISPVRWLVNATEDTGKPTHDLYLSRDEAEELAKIHQLVLSKHGSNWPVAGCDQIVRIWKNILMGRVTSFQQSGLMGLKDYQNYQEPYSLSREIEDIFKDQKVIGERFASILDPLMKGYHQQPGITPPVHYLEFSKVSGHGILTLGSMFDQPGVESSKAVEMQYYVSSEFYTSLMLYELWPVVIDGKPQTLIWRGDYVLSPIFFFSKGVQRLATAKIMLIEVKKSLEHMIQR